MSQLSNRIFNPNSYVYGNRFNYGFMASVLDVLKMSQHKYKREDVVYVYRFLAWIIENGKFDWSGTFDLKPQSKSAKVETKEAEKEVASVSEDTTSKTIRKRTAKPTED